MQRECRGEFVFKPEKRKMKKSISKLLEPVN